MSDLTNPAKSKGPALAETISEVVEAAGLVPQVQEISTGKDGDGRMREVKVAAAQSGQQSVPQSDQDPHQLV